LKTSVESSTQRVFTTSVFSDNTEITVDVDQITNSGGEKGLKVYLKGLISLYE
jgi:hypothetical protein